MALQQRLGPTFGVFCRTVLHQGDLLSGLVTFVNDGFGKAQLNSWLTMSVYWQLGLHYE